jgi:hypothetical protein
MMHLFKKTFVKKYLCWFTYRKPYVLYITMLERMAGSISSSRNITRFIDDYSNSYRSMMIDAMKMNLDYSVKVYITSL